MRFKTFDNGAHLESAYLKLSSLRGFFCSPQVRIGEKEGMLELSTVTLSSACATGA